MSTSNSHFMFHSLRGNIISGMPEGRGSGSSTCQVQAIVLVLSAGIILRIIKPTKRKSVFFLIYYSHSPEPAILNNNRGGIPLSQGRSPFQSTPWHTTAPICLVLQLLVSSVVVSSHIILILPLESSLSVCYLMVVPPFTTLG